MIANAVASAATPSASASGGSSGGPSGSPFSAAKPLIASASVPNPARRAYGPVCPKPVTRAITSARVHGPELVGACAPALERAGTEVLEHDVGALGQAQEEVAAVGLREVERDQPLVARRAP